MEIDLDILEKFIQDSRNDCGCFTPNEMHIKLTSLIIYLIKYNLTNTSSTPPPEEKKTVLYITHLIILYIRKTAIYWKFKDKIFNLF